MLKRSLKAFTLLECLVALLTIAGSISIYNGLTKIVSSNVHYLSNNEESDWLLFCQQFRSELEETTFQRIEDGKLYVKKDNKELAFGKSRSTDFRKTNADGRGYQPMLLGIKEATISQSAKIVRVDIVFENGLERTFMYAFEEN
ncbi:competence type IV pilus minor pilin ComGF [Streptococcus macacae]|uniref:Competence protein ComGF n=1 Tax=Streptococcus macacae NCTC 11558 TaxID=764298 RepID=G5JWB2_9STRE|nr:competence type IV pilus minor pilin ComGF [Streptococcus macacae]EHJ51890.1 hypothetical protein STRMA_1858 [Streptococcus macacae NCTC 11558]SUN77767.1 competence protein ComGF [Streptococcus macacae NCTC 11558]